MFIKNIELPKIVDGLAESEYLICLNQDASVIFEEMELRFNEGGRVSFDTTFNRLDVQQWKNNILLDTPQLKLKGTGTFLIRFGLHRFGHAHKWLSEQEIMLNKTDGLEVDLFFWNQLESGVVYFTVEALTDGSLTSGCLQSADAKSKFSLDGVNVKYTPPYSIQLMKRKNLSMNPIQQLVLPSLMFSAPEDMYVRLWNDKVTARISEKRVCFRLGGKVSFDTYFNGITVGAWKKECPIEDLTLNLTGKGKFLLRFGLHRIGHGQRWLYEKEVELKEGDSITSIDLPFWSRLQEGMLYFTLEALAESELTGGFYSTQTTPVNDAKLGIVITHFNRKQYVLPAIDRIREELLSDPFYKDKIELVVVDNSQNITKEEATGITLIPNQNLGGAGGFTRGLLHLQDENFTHCLFMDDDASCEIESIRRTYALLQYAKIEKFAIAGSLLRELEPNRLFEKGAKFNGNCRPLKSGLNMSSVHELLIAELVDEMPDYGGWWFFAYKIKDVDFYAFPFFVRGDDSMFAITNKFNLHTYNGISAWGDDFALKSGPLPSYLDLRYHILHSMVILNKGRIFCAKLAFKFFTDQLFSYNYASAKAIRLAFEHFQMGPTFFEENMDTQKIRQTISAFAGSEKLIPVNRAEFNVVYRNPHERMVRKVSRYLTLNGFLLPDFLLKDRVAYQHKTFHALAREIFRFKKVLYEYEPMSIGYIAVHDKKQFFSEMSLFISDLWRFVKDFDQLKAAYIDSVPKMTTESFWRNVYAKIQQK